MKKRIGFYANSTHAYAENQIEDHVFIMTVMYAASADQVRAAHVMAK
jgi:hypothetical protein